MDEITRCEQCRYWVRGPRLDMGECRERSPRVFPVGGANGTGQIGGVTLFPSTFANSGCGDGVPKSV